MTELLTIIQTRYLYMEDERGKAMERKDAIATVVYQVLMMEYSALIEYLKSINPT